MPLPPSERHFHPPLSLWLPRTPRSLPDLMTMKSWFSLPRTFCDERFVTNWPRVPSSFHGQLSFLGRVQATLTTPTHALSLPPGVSAWANLRGRGVEEFSGLSLHCSLLSSLRALVLGAVLHQAGTQLYSGTWGRCVCPTQGLY